MAYDRRLKDGPPVHAHTLNAADLTVRGGLVLDYFFTVFGVLIVQRSLEYTNPYPSRGTPRVYETATSEYGTDSNPA